ncbi:MAG TPA: ABC transporter permease subunit [Mycobacteriales bacterium]|nr:ABC transporter permease subunit [Mycobacteriales bacterium]
MRRDVWVIARLALQEAVRRRVLAVVAVLTVGCGALYLVGCITLRHHLEHLPQFQKGGQLEPLVPATLLGLASFATLFLGSVLAVFLAASAVKGDADRGLVQPLVVRPVGRPTYLAGRAVAAMAVSGGFVLVVSVVATVVTRLLFSSLPPHAWAVIPPLVVAVLVVTMLTLLVSSLLSTVATGISVLMAYGAGLIAGLLGELARAFSAHTLAVIANTVSYLLPFEALYRDALARVSPSGAIGQLVQLGPLGGAHSGGVRLWLFTVGYLCVCSGLTVWVFSRSDL